MAGQRLSLPVPSPEKREKFEGKASNLPKVKNYNAPRNNNTASDKDGNTDDDPARTRKKWKRRT